MSGQAVSAADCLQEIGMFVYVSSTGRQYKVLIMKESGGCSCGGLVVILWDCGKTVNGLIQHAQDGKPPMSPSLEYRSFVSHQ